MILMVRLRSFFLLVFLLQVGAQGPEIGFCGSYETSKNFNQNFISEMENSETSYTFFMSTGQTGGCKKLTFYSTNIYYYQTTDLSDNPTNVSATFETQPYSASSPATITLSELPFAELGSLLGSVTFNVLKAEKDQLVLLSCHNIGLIRFRQLHVLVPEVNRKKVSPGRIRSELRLADVPLADQLKKLPQSCPSSPTYRGI